MATSRADFHAGKAAAAFAASQRAGDLPPRTPAGHEADTDTYERARQQRAARRGCAYVPPTPVVEEAYTPIGDMTIKCDAELARIAVGLHRSAELRVWLVIQEHARITGFNYISKSELQNQLSKFNIRYSIHNLNRWLRTGQGVFWRLTTFGRVYLVSYENVAAALVTAAYTHRLPDLVSTNAPGQSKAMYIQVASSNLQQFEAQCFAAWYASRNNPTISRYTLQHLWNRSPKKQRAMERLSGVTVITNEVETTDPANIPLDSRGGIRTDVYRTIEHNQTVYHFRLPNTFRAPMIRQHNRRGASRRVAYRIHDLLASDDLTIHWQEGACAPGELSRTGRVYCADDKQAKRSRRRGYGGALFIPDRPGKHQDTVWRINANV